MDRNNRTTWKENVTIFSNMSKLNCSHMYSNGSPVPQLWNLNHEEMAMQEGPCVRAITDHGGAILVSHDLTNQITRLGHMTSCSV